MFAGETELELIFSETFLEMVLAALSTVNNEGYWNCYVEADKETQTIKDKNREEKARSFCFYVKENRPILYKQYRYLIDRMLK